MMNWKNWVAVAAAATALMLTAAVAVRPLLAESSGSTFQVGETGWHHRTRSRDDELLHRLTWPADLDVSSKRCRFKVEEFLHAEQVVSAVLYQVPFDGEPPEFEVWAEGLVQDGGPEVSSLEPMGNPLTVRKEDGVSIIEVEDLAVDPVSPLYIEILDDHGAVLDSILFGPLFEGASSVHSCKYDLDLRK